MGSFRRVVACNDPTFLIMLAKPEKIIKRIIKAVGSGQSVLVIGDWGRDEVTSPLLKGIKEKQNVIARSETTKQSYKTISSNEIASPSARNDNVSLPFEDNSFTRVIADYNSSVFNDEHLFFNEARRLLLPTGMMIVSANCKDSIMDKIIKVFKKEPIKEESIKKIKPKELQDQIHDHGFLIDGYYGYPGGHLLMMAQIINKEVTTLFNTKKQETVVK